MGKGSSTPPPAPDPGIAIQQQGASNIETAIATALLNQQNTVDPFGTTSFSQIGSTNIPGTQTNIPQFQRETELSELGQQKFDAQQLLEAQLAGLAGENIGAVREAQATPFDLSGLPEFRQGIDTAGFQQIGGDFAQQGQELEQASFNRALGLLNPEFARQQNLINVNLSERGLPQGSEAAQGVIDPFERRRNESLQQAAFQAVGAGREEQDRLQRLSLATRGAQLGEGLQGVSLQNQARQQGIQEQAFLRGLPINEIATLLGTAGGTQLPQFQPTANIGIAGTDVIGARLGAGQIEQDRFRNQQEANSGFLSGLFGLGSSAVTAFGPQIASGIGNLFTSDIRVKENIKPYGYYKGHRLYSYNYIWEDEPQIGVMAQEIEKVIPAAVSEINGIKRVNYGMI